MTTSDFPCRRQSGLTLIELMISIVLGLLVVLAATALLVSSKTAYLSQDEGVQMQDTARFALENINRSVRQAGFENWDKDTQDAPIVATPDMDPNITGWDAKSVGATSTAIDTPLSANVNGSDLLAVRFFGVSKPGTSVADESIFDCAGYGISGPATSSSADEDRGWSIYYVANSTVDGVPELRCKYRAEASGSFSWKSEAIARGVDSFQVLYGVDTDGDRTANQFMTATQIRAKDTALSLTKKNTYWKKVVAIKIALLVRGTQARKTNQATQTYHLFGEMYSTANAANDTGAKVVESSLAADVRQRVRKTYMTTTQFRNQPEGSGS
jgi:type IV pilus assembly protein PilW